MNQKEPVKDVVCGMYVSPQSFPMIHDLLAEAL
jgi:hypothetical protein